MKYMLYCVFDKVARKSSPPFVATNHSEAYRKHTINFDNIKDPRNPNYNPNLNLEDFELHMVGYFDDEYILNSDYAIRDVLDTDFSSPEYQIPELRKFTDFVSEDHYLTIDADYLKALTVYSYKSTRSELGSVEPKTRSEVFNG